MITLPSVCAGPKMNRTWCESERKVRSATVGVKIWEVNVLCLPVNRGHRQLCVTEMKEAAGARSLFIC